MQQVDLGALRWRPLWLGFVCALAAGRSMAFDFDDVAREAERLARVPYRKPPPADPALANLSQEAYRKQRFRAENSTWRDSGTPFELRYLPLGREFAQPLAMFEVADGVVRPLRLPLGAFETTGNTGVAGWRLHRWAGQPRRSDEVIAFLGASYFRAVAGALVYGLSARGLAVDTVGGGGEEFPVFTTFWVQRPNPGDNDVRFFALLESPRVTGAYGFVVRADDATTTIDVRARLTLRPPVARLGIAPLTSMFLAGEIQPMPDQYRPKVHDSNGLQVATGSGEWLWRPPTNPTRVFVTSFAMPQLRGFGLMQRDRSFASYQDLDARYEQRPSAWIEPLNDWGPGRVELLRRETPLPAGRTQVRVDFTGPALDGLSEADVEAVASGNDNVRELSARARPHAAQQGWRVTLDFVRIDPKKPVELRVVLRAGNRTLSETWSHAWAPE